MAFVDLRFSEDSGKDSDESIYDIWPGFPDELLSGNDPSEILKESIDAIMDIFACNCLATEIIDGYLVVHCGGLDSPIQDRMYDFYLVDEKGQRTYLSI